MLNVPFPILSMPLFAGIYCGIAAPTSMSKPEWENHHHHHHHVGVSSKMQNAAWHTTS